MQLTVHVIETGEEEKQKLQNIILDKLFVL